MSLMVLGAFKRVADRTLLPAREVLMRHMTLGALSPVRARTTTRLRRSVLMRLMALGTF